jgi:hypothetical protein
MMMNFLPLTNELGPMEMVEVYEFSDKPLLFSCKDAAGCIFMAVLVDEDEDFETWLYAKLSPGRFEHLRSGAIDLHDTFSATENGLVFEIQVPHHGEQPISVKAIPSSSIGQDRLPLPGEYLTSPPPESDQELVEAAHLFRRLDSEKRKFALQALRAWANGEVKRQFE